MKHYNLKNLLLGRTVAKDVTVPQAIAIAELCDLKENTTAVCECWVLEPINEVDDAQRSDRCKSNESPDEEHNPN